MHPYITQSLWEKKSIKSIKLNHITQTESYTGEHTSLLQRINFAKTQFRVNYIYYRLHLSRCDIMVAKKIINRSIESKVGFEALFINGNTFSEMIRRDVDINYIPQTDTQDRYSSALQKVYMNNILRLLDGLDEKTNVFEMHNVRMIRHSNGNGWVQDSVVLNDNTFVPKGAVIFGNNDITNARIMNNTVIGNPYDQITNDKRRISGVIM